ncbi:MAG: hypothetical protein J5919_06160 [Clostridia bacterium]|nr:hypothetical protein [Clostridia bacterium]
MRRRAVPVTVAALLASLLLSAALAGCASSDTLFTEDVDGFLLTAFCRPEGISRIKVTADEGEKILLDERFTHRAGDEPYTAEDGLRYGLTVGDFDNDGNTDIAVQTSRKAGAEKYSFFFGTGEGFEYSPGISAISAPDFGRGTGYICSNIHSIIFESKDVPGQPDIYTEELMTEIWGRDENGLLSKVGGTSLTFYSEEDIYRVASYIPDPDNPGSLIEDEERWVGADRLAEFGYSAFTGGFPH